MLKNAQSAVWVVRLALVVSAVVAFAPGLNSPLTTYDDPMYLAQNTQPGWAGFASVWNNERAWSGQFIEFFPLRDSVYWLIYQQWQLAPLPYHVAGLLFHVLACLLAFELLRRLTPSFWVASIAALLFAVHPMHSESVTWVSGLKDPMYTSAVFGSLLAYLSFRSRQQKKLYVVSLVLLVLALLVKSMALSTPLLMLAMERLVEPRAPWRVTLQRLVLPGFICAVFLAQFIGISRAYHMEVGPHGGTWTSHLVLSAWAQVVYLKQVLVPNNTQLIYCFTPVSALADFRLLAAVVAAGAVLTFIWRFKNSPLLMLGIAWYFACLATVSNLFPFPAIVADRYLYAASFGICLVVAELFERFLVRAKHLVAAVLLLALTLTTAFRSTVWNHPDELWGPVDEDPACMVDPEKPALEAHLRRFVIDPVSPTGLAALERAVASAALKQRDAAENCGLRVTLAMAELRAGQPLKAAQAAQVATKLCPERSDVWFAALQVTLHRAPAAARRAAEQLNAVTRDAGSRTWLAVTTLEVEPDNTGALADLDTAVGQGEPQACQSLADFRAQASESLRTLTASAAQRCIQK